MFREKKEGLMKKILILSDSVLTSVGTRFNNAIDILCNEIFFSSQVEVINYSVIGLTTADALLYLQEIVSKTKIDLLIVYLGNCDASGFGYLKPDAKFYPRKYYVSKINSKYRKQNSLSRRNKPFQFVDHNFKSNKPVRCVSPDDYSNNLNRIIKVCDKTGTGVVLINPVSKLNFQPCNNTGNYIYYKLCGIYDNFDYPFDEGTSPLVEAISLQNKGKLEESLERYTDIIQNLRAGNEQISICKNNKAVIYFELGEFDNACELIESIDTQNCLREIIEYNKAHIFFNSGRKAEAEKILISVRESDTGTYRITNAYREKIFELVNRNKGGIELIDLADKIYDFHFYDYCHPTINGHKIIADLLIEKMIEMLKLEKGDKQPHQIQVPVNPDKYAGFKSSFFDYFGITSESSADFSKSLLFEIENSSYEDMLHKFYSVNIDQQLKNRLRILCHPLFGTKEFLTEFPPNNSIDQGQLPEFYFVRSLLPLLNDPNKNQYLIQRFPLISQILPNINKIKIWWSFSPLDEKIYDKEKLAKIFTKKILIEIEQRCLKFIDEMLSNEPVVYNKYRSITYWFFRESMLFGTASDTNIFIDRIGIFYAVTSCVFATWFLGKDTEEARPFNEILILIEKLLQIHENYLSVYADKIYDIPKNHFGKYKNEISGFRELNFSGSI